MAVCGCVCFVCGSVAVTVAAAAWPPGHLGFIGSQWQEVDTQIVRLGLCHCLKTTNLCLSFSLFDPAAFSLFMAALHHPDDGPF